MISKPILIAVDGPAASGKGTIARQIAEKLGVPYLDTGKLYRMMGLKYLQGMEEEGALGQAAAELDIAEIAQHDLSSEEVGKAASIVSAMPAVRAGLLQLQQNVAATPEGAVLDGRDIGTVICPDADVKLFITASVEERAKRRTKQLQEAQQSVTYAQILADLQARDARDVQRNTAPLKPAEDAVVIDSTTLSIAEVLSACWNVIERVAS